jgi:hypothetical protein
MSDQKWILDATNPAGPIQAKRFNKAWRKFAWENNTYTELTGVKGVDERSSTLTNIFGVGMPQRQDVAEAKQRIGERFNWTISKANAGEIVSAIEEELPKLKAGRTIKDERRTPEEDTKRNEEIRQIEKEQGEKSAQERETFASLYGSGQTVTVQPGQMAVTARVCYDNSDAMTDYFDSHAGLSSRFALLIVSKQAETERLARAGQNVSELLRTLTFEWKTEKYSMGHGNYLIQRDGFELPPELKGIRRYYRGGEVNRGHWEIEFEAAYSHPVELPAIRGFGQTPTTNTLNTPTSATGDAEVKGEGGITVSENTEKGGIEIRFPSKPETEVLERLKANGWRWSRFSSCWYKRASEEARTFANELACVSV